MEEEDGEDEPKIFGQTVEQYSNDRDGKVIIYYLNGNKKIYDLKTKTWI